MPQGQKGMGVMQVMGRGDVDQVHLRALNQFLVAAEGQGHAVFFRLRPGAGSVSGRKGCQFAMGCIGQIRHDPVKNAAQAHDSHAQLMHVIVHPFY